jgi:cobalamin biosynthesis Mg chelatase CobN
MSRRICLLFLAVSFALAAPAASLAQSSSQAQYQGVAPETSTPVSGSGGTPGAGTNGTSSSGGSGGTSGTGGSTQSSGTTSGASGNGGGGANAPAATGGQFTPPAVTPNASSDTAPFSSGDWVWIVIALAALTGLGFLLRRATRAPIGT